MLDKKICSNLQFVYRSYVKKPMEKTLKELYQKCINGSDLTKNECSFIYSFCCCRSSKEFPIDVLAAYVFHNEFCPFGSEKEYRSLFIMIYKAVEDKIIEDLNYENQ